MANNRSNFIYHRKIDIKSGNFENVEHHACKKFLKKKLRQRREKLTERKHRWEGDGVVKDRKGYLKSFVDQSIEVVEFGNVCSVQGGDFAKLQ